MRKLFCTITGSLFFCVGLLYTATAQPSTLVGEPKLLASFPFKTFSGGVMVLQARVGNIKDTFNFILDTGSGGISLDSATCADYKLPSRPTDTIITGIAGAQKTPFVFNHPLHLPGLTVPGMDFHVVDYSILSSVYGEKIDGIIGYSFLKNHIVQVDFDSTVIHVYSPGVVNYPRGGFTLHPIFTSLAIQWLNIKDARKMGFNFYIDTGAGLCLLMSEQFVKENNFLLSRRKPVITQVEGVGGRLQMRLTVIKRLRLGPYTFYNVPTYLYDDLYNVTGYPFVGGVIGNDMLRRFNLTINYPAREVHLLPNSHFREPFDYVYTGLGIYFEEGLIKVEDVAPGSPAEKAGIKIGDVVVSIGNNFSNNIMSYKNTLQTPNEKLKIIVQRAGMLLELKLRTERIF